MIVVAIKSDRLIVISLKAITMRYIIMIITKKDFDVMVKIMKTFMNMMISVTKEVQELCHTGK